MVLTWVTQSKLVRTILLTMALRVASVILISALCSYLYLVEHTEIQIKEQLSTYVAQRSQQEASLFNLAQDRHNILKQALLDNLEPGPDNALPSQKPPPLQLQSWPDGTQRNFPSDRPLDEFDGQHQSSLILGRNVQLTPELRHRLSLFQQLVMQYGPAWRDRFTNTYIAAPENAVVVYWPEVPGPLMVPGDFELHQEPFFYLSDAGHNPSRQTAWTKACHDPASPDWIISVVTPVDSPQGQHLATIGQDIILTELIEKTNRDRLSGTQNLIFSPEGQLIVHPQFGAEIQAKNGQLNVQDLANPHLSRIFELVLEQMAGLDKDASTTQAPEILENPSDGEFLAVAQLEGPGWYFVTVYPKALMDEEAVAAAQFVLFSGLLALLVEMTLLYKVLQQKVAQPLGLLVGATEQLAQGTFDQPELEAKHRAMLQHRSDEIGQLSQAFEAMAQQLRDLFAHQEQRIKARTAQLKAANQVLEQLSLADSLTQLANRRCFDETLEKELKRQQREQQPLSLLMCDIDYFKLYNDRYGHPAGDECLKAIAQYLREISQRPADLAARYGGEEFAVILPATSLVEAMAMAQRLCDRTLAAQLAHSDSPISPWVTISVGVATCLPHPIDSMSGPTSPESLSPSQFLITAADQALYAAKQAGRNQVASNQPVASSSRSPVGKSAEGDRSSGVEA